MTEEQEKRIMDAIEEIKKYSLIAAKEVLLVDDVSVLTGISKSTIYKMTCNRSIPHYKPSGKCLYFDKREIENWMRQNRVNTNEESEQKALAYILKGKEEKPEAQTYIVLDVNSHLYKIGKAVNIENRLSGLRCANPGLQLIAYNIKNVENELHQKCKKYHVFREWFDIPDKELRKIIKDYEFNVEGIDFEG
jgi:excisionase family DNA binding protein